MSVEKFDGRRVRILIYGELFFGSKGFYYDVKHTLFYLFGFTIWTWQRFGPTGAYT
jgi:hypothetical protein